MNAMSVGKPSLTNLPLLYIRKSTEERNPMSVMSVERPSLGSQPLLSISGPTWGRNLMNWSKVGMNAFSEKSYLIVHQRTHRGEKPNECKECRKTSVSQP